MPSHPGCKTARFLLLSPLFSAAFSIRSFLSEHVKFPFRQEDFQALFSCPLFFLPPHILERSFFPELCYSFNDLPKLLPCQLPRKCLPRARSALPFTGFRIAFRSVLHFLFFHLDALGIDLARILLRVFASWYPLNLNHGISASREPTASDMPSEYLGFLSRRGSSRQAKDISLLVSMSSVCFTWNVSASRLSTRGRAFSTFVENPTACPCRRDYLPRCPTLLPLRPCACQGDESALFPQRFW